MQLFGNRIQSRKIYVSCHGRYKGRQGHNANNPFLHATREDGIGRAASRSGKGFRVRFGILSVRMARRRACKPLLGVCGSFPGQINGGLIACVPDGWILTGNRLGNNDSCWQVGWNGEGGPPRIRKSSICHGLRTEQGLSGLDSERNEAETESGYSWGSKRVYVRDRITCSTDRGLGRKIPFVQSPDSRGDFIGDEQGQCHEGKGTERQENPGDWSRRHCRCVIMQEGQESSSGPTTQGLVAVSFSITVEVRPTSP